MSIKHCREDQDYRGGMMAGVAKTDNAPQAHIASGVRPLADATVKLTTSRIRDSLLRVKRRARRASATPALVLLAFTGFTAACTRSIAAHQTYTSAQRHRCDVCKSRRQRFEALRTCSCASVNHCKYRRRAGRICARHTATMNEQAEIQRTIEKALAKRNKARSKKMWSVADDIRNMLKEMGVLIQDTGPNTSEWRWAKGALQDSEEE